MTNALTGDYEAVFEIAIPQLNGLLGTLHQNGGIQGATLVTPHSETGSLNDRVITLPVSGVFEDWVTGIQRAGPGLGVRDIQNELTAAAPPGAAQMLTDAFAELRAGWGNIPPIFGTVSGSFNLQASNVTVTVPNGSSSEVDINVQIRAVYYPNSGTIDLPAPIHGTVQAAFEVSTVYRRRFGIRLVITPSTDNSRDSVYRGARKRVERERPERAFCAGPQRAAPRLDVGSRRLAPGFSIHAFQRTRIRFKPGDCNAVSAVGRGSACERRSTPQPGVCRIERFRGCGQQGICEQPHRSQLRAPADQQLQFYGHNQRSIWDLCLGDLPFQLHLGPHADVREWRDRDFRHG